MARKTKPEYKPNPNYTKADWDEVSDNPEWTKEDFANAKPFAEVFPELAASIKRPGPPKTKEAVSIRLDIDLLEQLRAKGAGWQSRVNALIRKHLEEV
jgi:uncharacterized protein (DUF4415 family)